MSVGNKFSGLGTFSGSGNIKLVSSSSSSKTFFIFAKAQGFTPTAPEYSTDGINWNKINGLGSKRWANPIKIGNQVLIYARDNNISKNIAYLTTNFSDFTNTEVSNQVSNAVYGNGKAVGVDFDNLLPMYSTDGINWNNATMPSGYRSTDGNNIYFKNNMFITSMWNSSGDSYLCYSTDGINWSASSFNRSISSVEYNNGVYVIANNYGIYSGSDINSLSMVVNESYWNSLSYGNGKFVATNGGNPTACNKKTAYSTDGVNWTLTTDLPVSDQWNSIVYANNKFVVSGGHQTNQSNHIAYSTDGVTWTLAAAQDYEKWFVYAV